MTDVSDNRKAETGELNNCTLVLIIRRNIFDLRNSYPCAHLHFFDWPTVLLLTLLAMRVYAGAKAKYVYDVAFASLGPIGAYKSGPGI